MGCCYSIAIGDEQTLEKLRDQEIEEQIKNDRQQMNREVKLLLLGAGESGKSTLLKQMIIIHNKGFSKDEKLSYREIIYNNMIDSMSSMIHAIEKLEIDAYHEYYDLIVETKECGYTLPENIAQAMEYLWLNDQGIKSVYEKRNKYQLKDSTAYYFDNIQRIAHADYIPTEQDILRARVKTTGITETRVEVGQLIYRMLDVGGQRSERKKWIHCFEDVTAIIFMVALSEYDQVLFEDETVNRMSESLVLFQSICTMEYFKNTSIILFMNKTDIFKSKLKANPLANYFPAYKGGADYELACQFLLKQFQNITTNSNKNIYTHFTCATDTNQIKFVMAVVNDIILQANLRHVGLL